MQDIGKQIEEKVGRQFRDNMTPAKASLIRADRIRGRQLSNKEKRETKKAQGQIWTVSKLWEAYKESHEIKGIVIDGNRFKNHLEAGFGNRELKNISPLDVDRVRVNLLKKLKPQTVQHVLEVLKRISNFAVNKNLCPAIPFKIPKLKFSNLQTEDLTSEQLEGLLRAIDEDIHPLAGLLMKMALFTGMRRGELFSLKWADVDFERGFISIRGPKGGQDAKIPLNAEAREVLEALPRDSEYCFSGRGGRKRIDINKAVNVIKKRAGLPREFRPLHGLRHVYASMLASSGQVDLYTLQKLLTHKSPIMTQRYAHLRDETLKRASALAGELVNKAATGE
jgi:integrase